jgi:glycosyltransferase involved in cell wall biosynthesis
VSPSFYPTKAYGGTIRSGYGLCRGLAELGCSVRVLTADTDGPGHTLEVRNDEDVQVDALRVHYCHKQFRHSISFGLLRVLPEYPSGLMLCILLPCIRSRPSPHCHIAGSSVNQWCGLLGGSLQRWDGSTRVIAKSLWESGYRNLALKGKLVLHTTSQAEAAQSLNRFPGVRTVVVRNGVDLPMDLRKTDSKGEVRMAYLGRLDPIKDIEALLEACNLGPGVRALASGHRWNGTISLRKLPQIESCGARITCARGFSRKSIWRSEGGSVCEFRCRFSALACREFRYGDCRTPCS